MDRVGLSEVIGQRIAGVSRTGLSAKTGRRSDVSASCYCVTVGDRFEHPSKCQSVRHLCLTVRAIRH